jgi:hypothetical protein
LLLIKEEFEEDVLADGEEYVDARAVGPFFMDIGDLLTEEVMESYVILHLLLSYQIPN